MTITYAAVTTRTSRVSLDRSVHSQMMTRRSAKIDELLHPDIRQARSLTICEKNNKKDGEASETIIILFVVYYRDTITTRSPLRHRASPPSAAPLPSPFKSSLSPSSLSPCYIGTVINVLNNGNQKDSMMPCIFVVSH